MQTLNPADPRPLYQQLAAVLRERIRTGDLPPGERMPTEAQLAESYDASRNTIRLALDVLRNEGLITSRQGRGSFVRAEPPMRYHASLAGSRRKRLETKRSKDTFTQQVEANGKTPRQVSTVQTIPAGAGIGSWLALGPADQVAARRRVMYADDEPIQLGDSYYPLAVVQDSKIMDEDNIPEGTDQVLEDLGHTPARYEDEITWRMPTAEEATMLRIDPGVPVAQVVRVSLDQHDQRVEAYVLTLPGDRHVLRYEIDAE
jgi:GntR family transcriptional regulator